MQEGSTENIVTKLSPRTNRSELDAIDKVIKSSE